MPIYKSLVRKVSIPAQNKIKQTDYLPKGAYPVIDQGHELIGGYTDDPSKLVHCRLPVIVFGDHTKAVKYITFPFAAGADGIKVLEVAEGIDPRFLFYATKYLTYKIENKGYARHYQFVEKKGVSIPELPEQQRIVARIEELFSQLDDAEATLQKAKAQLALYRQAVLKEAFQGKEQWDKYTFNDLLSGMRNGYGEKPTDSGDYKILRISAVRPMLLNLSDYRMNQSAFTGENLIQENDLLFTRYNGSQEYVGVCARVPSLDGDYAYPDKIIRCRLKQPGTVLAKYLMYYLNSGDARKYIRSKIKTTSGQRGIAGGDIKKTIVYIPNVKKQADIIAYIESRLSLCDSIEHSIHESLLLATAVRHSILRQYIYGGTL